MKRIACEVCGSNQLIKKEGCYYCEYCGTKYALEDVRDLLNALESSQEKAGKNQLYKKANDLMILGDYNKAYCIYEQITDEYPGDWMGWAKLAEFPFQLLVSKKIFPSLSSLLHSLEYEKAAKKLNKNFSLGQEYWDALISNHSKLKVNKEIEYLNKESCDGGTTYLYCQTVLDKFDSDLICCDTEKLNSYLKQLQYLLTNEYCERFISGDLFLFTTTNGYYKKILGCSGRFYENLPYANKPLNDMIRQGKELANLINKAFVSSSENKQRFFYELLGDNVHFRPTDYSPILFVLGKTIVYNKYVGDGYTDIYIKRLTSSLTKTNVNSILKKYGLKLYSIEAVKSAQRFIINFFMNTIDKDNTLDYLSTLNDTYAALTFHKTYNDKIHNAQINSRIISINNIGFYPANDYDCEMLIKCTIQETTTSYSSLTKDKYQHTLSCERNYEIQRSSIEISNKLREYNASQRIGLCNHCGGKLKGVFSKVCSQCGMPKDY